MAAHAIDDETWAKLLKTLRDDPTRNVTAAARKAGVSYPTAKKAWAQGYPNATPPRAPIERILQEETIAARAAMQGTIEDEARRAAMEDAARKRAEAEKARADAVEARRQEASMVRAQRGNVLGLIAAAGSCVRGAIKLAESVRADLEAGTDGGKAMSVSKKMAALSRIGLLTQRIASSASDVVKMERLLLGEPTEILGHRAMADVDFEAALKELESASDVAKRIRDRRVRREAFKLKVLQGGKGAA